MLDQSCPEYWGAAPDFSNNASPGIQSAIDATGMVTLTGKYRCDGPIYIRNDGVTVRGTGNPHKTQLKYNFPGAGTLLHVQATNPNNLIQLVTLKDFGIVAEYPHNHKKVGAFFSDASVVTIDNVIFPDWSWTGSKSVGFHFAGRDQHTVRNCVVTADRPIYVSKNINSSVYQFDVYHLHDVLLQILDPDEYAITFAPGVNISQFRVDGRTIVLMGKGGIWYNDTETGTATSSQIQIENFRVESGIASGGNPGGHAVHMKFGASNPYCGNISISHSSANDVALNGYVFERVANVELRHVNCGSAANLAIGCTDVLALHLDMVGIGHDNAIVSIPGMVPISSAGYNHVSPNNMSTLFGWYKKA